MKRASLIRIDQLTIYAGNGASDDALSREVHGIIDKLAVPLKSFTTAPAQRFELSDDGTIVIDHKLQLMWPVDESANALTFEGAEAYAAACRLGDFADWRLPDEHELSSLRDLSRHNPCIDTNFFQSRAGCTWTRTPCAWSSDRVWFVLFYGGDVSYLRRDLRAFVRPVRSLGAGQ